MLKSSEAWAPRQRFCLNRSMFRYFKSVWLLFWLPGVRATSNCWRSLSGHGLSIPWVALSSLGDRQTRQAPQTICYWIKFRASPKKRGFSEIYFALSLAILGCGFCAYQLAQITSIQYTVGIWFCPALSWCSTTPILALTSQEAKVSQLNESGIFLQSCPSYAQCNWSGWEQGLFDNFLNAEHWILMSSW